MKLIVRIILIFIFVGVAVIGFFLHENIYLSMGLVFIGISGFAFLLRGLQTEEKSDKPDNKNT